MKQCPNCGAQINDDSHFCTECGKPIPQGSICPHCGASVNDGDFFCQSCGKRINELQSESPSYEPIINDEEKKSGFKKYLPYIIGAFVLFMIIGYFSSNESNNTSSNGSVEAQVIDSVDNVSAKELTKGADYTESDIEAAIKDMYDEVFGSDESFEIDEKYTSSDYKTLDAKAAEVADGDLYIDANHWIQGQDCDKPSMSVISIKKESDNKAVAKVRIKQFQDSDDTSLVKLILLYENGKWVVDDFISIMDGGEEYSEKSYLKDYINEAQSKPKEDYSWLQGHWVYDVDVTTDRSYRIHVVIEGNRIIQYKNNRSESTNPTFTIENGEIRAQFYKDLETTYKIDPIKQSIDLGDGWRWMYKLGSDEEIRHRVGFETENTFFIKIANQLFRNREGNEIRFDENRKVYFNDIYAGTLSIVKLERKKATVNYSGGEFGEGIFDVYTDFMTSNFLMIDKPSDGTYSRVRSRN